MTLSRRRNRIALVAVSMSSACALVVACGGDDSATTIGPGDTDAGAGGADAALDGTKASTDAGQGNKDAGSSGNDSGVVDAGRDAQRVTNPDGGCDPVQNGEVYVDPNNGDDSATTPGGYVGQGYSAACALRTITKALEYVGSSPAAGTKIVVMGPSTVQTGETFPLTIPANVVVVGAGGKVTVTPGANDAFILSSASSGLANLTLAGANTSAYGVRAASGSASTTVVTDLDVTGFTAAGIYVQDTGVLGVVGGTKGVHVTGNSVGLMVTGSGKASVVAAAASGGVAFNANTNAGIDVKGAATLTVDGVPGPSDGTGSVLANANGAQGVLIEGATGSNAVTGLVAFANTGDGIAIYDTSTIVLRKSQALKNGANGVHVMKAVGALSATSPAKVDLGKNKDGKNVMQGTAANANGAAGLCFDNGALVSVQTLSAQGNIFSGVDCSAAAMSVSDNKNSCTGGVDVGLGGMFNAVDVTMCTLK